MSSMFEFFIRDAGDLYNLKPDQALLLDWMLALQMEVGEGLDKYFLQDKLYGRNRCGNPECTSCVVSDERVDEAIQHLIIEEYCAVKGGEVTRETLIQLTPFGLRSAFLNRYLAYLNRDVLATKGAEIGEQMTEALGAFMNQYSQVQETRDKDGNVVIRSGPREILEAMREVEEEEELRASVGMPPKKLH